MVARRGSARCVGHTWWMYDSTSSRHAASRRSPAASCPPRRSARAHALRIPYADGGGGGDGSGIDGAGGGGGASASAPEAAGGVGALRHVVVVGAGPCGLFAALRLAHAGVRVTLCERGKPVEERGRSIGALIKRGVLDPESNFCYGEGGAGTWSDGKLTTRIGRNSAEVRYVLETLVRFGAPERILLDGKPHLGTDNLVRLLKAFRAELIERGAEIMWDARVESLVLEADGDEAAGGGRAGAAAAPPPRVAGVRLRSGELLRADAVVLAAGHSARELYAELIRCGASLAPKDFAVGFRIEHPQTVINAAQYGDDLAAELCEKGVRARCRRHLTGWRRPSRRKERAAAVAAAARVATAWPRGRRRYAGSGRNELHAAARPRAGEEPRAAVVGRGRAAAAAAGRKQAAAPPSEASTRFACAPAGRLSQRRCARTSSA